MADKQGEERLDGWKAIARHLGRDERTVRRWEARGLPVNRVPGGPRAPVYGTVVELDRWLNANAGLAAAGDAEANGPAPPDAQPAPEDSPALTSRPRARGLTVPLLAAALGATAVLAATWPSPRKPVRSVESVALSAPVAAVDGEANADYLDGVHAWTMRTPTSLAQARQDFGAAIAREPGYAPAYAGLANTYLLLREFGSMADADAYPKAAAAADTALRLDPVLAAAHRARAFLLFWWKHDPGGAWNEFDRAAALAPADALTWHWYATAVNMAGRHGEALRLIQRARALDPASTAILTDEAMILYDAGSHAEGRAQLQRVIALDPANVDAHLYLAQIARYEGRADEYRNEMARADKLRGLRAADPSMATAGPRHAGVPTSTR